MANLNPRFEIANYFDELINRIDIDIEQSIKKYKGEQSLGELKCFPLENRNPLEFYFYKIIYNDLNESLQTGKRDESIEWSESTKVIDYLNQIRQRTIDELKKAQEESLEYLKSK